MMNPSSALYTKQYRLAQHYLDRLRTANRAYRHGDENTVFSLKLAQQDWPQIQHWQTWSATQVDQRSEAAALCSAYAVEAGDLLVQMLTPEEQRVWYEAGLAAARQAGDLRAELAHVLALSAIYVGLSQHTAASASAQQALALAERFSDHNSMGKALLQLGTLNHMAGNYVEARAYLARSCEQFRQVKDNPDLAAALAFLGYASFDLNELEAARSYLEQALRVYQQLSDDLRAAKILNALRMLFNDERSRLLAAQFNVEERLHVSPLRGDRLSVADLLTVLDEHAYLEGDFAAAERYEQQALDIYHQLALPRYSAESLLRLGILSIHQGRFVEGRDHLLEALAIARQYQISFLIGRNLVLLAFAYWGLGDAENVRAVLGEGLPLWHQFGILLTPLGVAGMAALRLLTGQAEAAALLAGLVDAYPGTTGEIRLFALGMLRSALESALGAERFAALAERGRTLDYEAAVVEIIAELSG